MINNWILKKIVLVSIICIFTYTLVDAQSIELISVSRVKTGSYLINDPVDMVVTSDGKYGFVLSRENRCLLVIDFMVVPSQVIDQINLPIQNDLFEMDLAYNHVRNELYITDSDTDNIYIVDINDFHKTIASISVPSPNALLVSPDGNYLYVSSFANPCQIHIINLTNHWTIEKITLADNFEPSMMHINNNSVYISGLLYENNFFWGALYLLNIEQQNPAQYQLTHHKIFKENIGNIAIHPNKQSIYVAHDSPLGNISVLDANDLSVLDTISQDHQTQFSKNPKDMIICRNFLYMVNSGENSIGLLDMQDNTFIKSVTSNGERPIRLHVSPDEQNLYVLNQASGSVDIVKINRYYQITIETPGKATGTVLIKPEDTLCKDRCELTFLENTSLSLQATPKVGYTFTGWLIAQCGGSNPCSISVVSDDIIQANFEKLPSYQPKAIMVAGGESGDISWDVIEKCVGYAYNALIYQGYEKEDIVLLSQKDFDYDGNGFMDDVDGSATKTMLFQALDRFKNNDHVVLYMMGHGTAGTFMINGERQLLASELKQAIEKVTGDDFIFIFDSCYSGSFIEQLIMPPGKGPGQLSIITSTDNDEDAFVSQKGIISFSHLFYSYIFGGASIKIAFDFAKAGMQSHQTAQVNANNVLPPTEKIDLFNILEHYIGLGKGNLEPVPEIQISDDGILKSGEHSALISIQCVAYSQSVQHVRSIIKPPNTNGLKDGQISSFPTLALTGPDLNDFYSASYNHFCQKGLYEIQVIAVNENGMVSMPVETVFYQESDYVSQFSSAIVHDDRPLLSLIKALQIVSGYPVGIDLTHPCEKVGIKDVLGLIRKISEN